MLLSICGANSYDLSPQIDFVSPSNKHSESYKQEDSHNDDFTYKAILLSIIDK